MNIFNMYKSYVFFFFFIFYFHESIFFNEEILLSLSLCSMFYIVYTYFSSSIWMFIKSEIDEIRILVIEEFENQLDRCNQGVFFLQSSIKIFYIPVFFCLWIYLINSFVIRLGLTRLNTETNKFFFYAAQRLFGEHLKVLSNVEFKKVRGFVTFIKIFSFFLFNFSKNVFVYLLPKVDEQGISIYNQLSFVYNFSSSIAPNIPIYLSTAVISKNELISARFFDCLHKNEMCFAVLSLKFSLIFKSLLKTDNGYVSFLFYFSFLI